MTTLGDSTRTKVGSVLTRVGIPMTLNEGTLGDFDFRSQRAKGTTITTRALTGSIYKITKERDGSQTVFRGTIVFGAAQVATLGATIKKGQTIIVGSETWTVDDIDEERIDATAAAYFLSVSRGA